MSTTLVEVVCIDAINPHPNADRLEVATIRGASVVVGKGTFAAGEAAVYFPPDILIPEDVSAELGVTKYLKHAALGPFGDKKQCRVAACRLRGVPSFGFLAKSERAAASAIGTDVSSLFGAIKYEPPMRATQGDIAPEAPAFHKYTDIENYWRYPFVFADGEPVVLTEKIHGTNSRIGRIDGEYMAGSHRSRRKPEAEGGNSMYWRPLDRPEVKAMLDSLDGNVIVYGEIYGGSVQDLDYGCAGITGYRVFDVSWNGSYLSPGNLESLCATYGVAMVPVVYRGPFSAEVVKQHTYGPTEIAAASSIRSAFKDREGVVIRPQKERYNEVVNGRVILKSVSADYLDRKGAEDNE